MSLVRADGRLRVMGNRDERHDRPPASPPGVLRAGSQLALCPRDPQSGGTWIAGTSAGLVFALLNGDGVSQASAPSRGQIIPTLLASASLDDVVAQRSALVERDWPSYRLLATDGDTLLDLRVTDGTGTVREQRLGSAWMVTSSSLGEAVVAGPRSALFERLVTRAADLLDGQDGFHRHRWPDRPHLSVHMRRHDAATQSITTVDLTASAVTMRYESTTEVVGQPAMISLDRRRSAPTWLEAGRAATRDALAVAS